MKTGVYTITNLRNNKIYVGSSAVNIYNRLTSHKKCLKGNYHGNDHLQKSFNKYGLDAFEFEVLELCEPELCLYIEQFWINILDSYSRNRGYNLRPNAANSSGFKHSEETKIILSKLKKGNNPTQETRKKISDHHTGKKHPNRGKSISKSLKGIPKSETHKIELSKSNSKKIYQLDLKGNLIKQWNSVKEAQKTLKCNNISKCALGKGRLKTVKNSKWTYEINDRIRQ